MSIHNDDDDDFKPRPTDITGNAATATKLRNPRLINNVSFDGTSDVRIIDLSGATGSDGKLLPTQKVLDSSIFDLQSKMDKGFAKRDIDITSVKNQLQVEVDSTNLSVGKLNKDLTDGLDQQSKNLTDLEADLKKLIDRNYTDIQTIDGTYNDTCAKLKRQQDKNTAALENLQSIQLPIGQGQTWRRAYTKDQAYRVNSTGRTIELRVHCGTAAADCLFRILTLDGTTPVELDRLYLTTETQLGTISCIIPPDTWWAVNYNEGIGASIAPIVLQDRPDFQAFQEYYSTVNGDVRYIIDTFGSENHYKGSDWHEY